MTKKISTTDPNLLTVNVREDVYRSFPTTKFLKRKQWQPDPVGVIRAIVAGVIREVLVKKGDTVERGDKILILEAMKMNNEILSPIKGTIEEVKVSVDQNIAKGDILFIICPNEEEAEPIDNFEGEPEDDEESLTETLV